jgi:hypothetical protein
MTPLLPFSRFAVVKVEVLQCLGLASQEWPLRVHEVLCVWVRS